MSYRTVKDLPEAERPRERLKQYGPEVLTTAELIAIVLGNGTKGKSVLQLAHEIVSSFPSLATARIDEFCAIRGLGEAKAVQLKAALSLGVRISRQRPDYRYIITSPLHAYYLLREHLEHEEVEVLAVILLDAKGYVIRWEKVTRGTLTETLIHPREVFAPAVRHRAASLIIAHNHPSGDPNPSFEDMRVTQALIEAGQTMGVPLQDHLIIGKRGFVSFKEQGILGKRVRSPLEMDLLLGVV